MDSVDPETMLRKGGYIFFWDGWPSNWWPSTFFFDGVEYSCMEQYMMAEKARLFGDELVRWKILATPYPRAQKEFGRKVRGYDDARWSAVRYGIVLLGVVEKCRQNKELAECLLATTETYVEASPHDGVWGIGMSMTDKGVEDPKNWHGENLLGRAITEARTVLRERVKRCPKCGVTHDRASWGALRLVSGDAHGPSSYEMRECSCSLVLTATR